MYIQALCSSKCNFNCYGCWSMGWWDIHKCSRPPNTNTHTQSDMRHNHYLWMFRDQHDDGDQNFHRPNNMIVTDPHTATQKYGERKKTLLRAKILHFVPPIAIFLTFSSGRAWASSGRLYTIRSCGIHHQQHNVCVQRFSSRSINSNKWRIEWSLTRNDLVQRRKMVVAYIYIYIINRLTSARNDRHFSSLVQ